MAFATPFSFLQTRSQKWDNFSYMEYRPQIRKQIAHRLFLLRSENGLSLDEVAQQSGISRATLSRIENADVSATADTLQALCATLGIPMSRLFAMIEERFPALVPFERQAEHTDPKTGFTRRHISPVSSHLLASSEEGHLPPGKQCEVALEGAPGQEVHLVLLDGALTVRLGKKQHDLTAGDCLRYNDYGSVNIQTPETRGARFLMFRVG